ncbi:unnamed protein product [Auanema sp. JU1783]|nr:unnamed protein product [Auanema sp. JU1783]
MTSEKNILNCKIAEELHGDVYLITLYSIKIFLCIISIISLSLLILFKFKKLSWIGHINGKLLFISHIVWSLLLPISVIICYSYDLHRHLTVVSNYCDLLVPMRFSTQLKLPFVTALTGQILSMLSLAIERAFSIFEPSKYEQITKPYLAIILIISTMVLSCYLTYGFLYFSYKDLNALTPLISTRSSESLFRSAIVSWFNCASEIIFIVIFILSLYKSYRDKKYFMRHGAQLGSKYQVEETRQVIHKLLPMCFLHFIISFSNHFFLAIYPWLYPNANLGKYAIYIEVISQSHLYSLFLPFILLYQLKSHHRIRQNVVVAHPRQDDYFYSLKTYFDQNYKK